MSANPNLQAEPADIERGASLGRQLLALLVLAGVVYSAYWAMEKRNAAPVAVVVGPPRAPLDVSVRTIAPEDVPLEAVYLAQTEPSETVPIRARVNGYLIERGFEEGRPVKRGQMLFRIDPAPFEVTLKQARAGLKAAQAQLDRADQQVARFKGLAELQRAATNELEQVQEDQRTAAAQVQLQQALVERAQLDLDYATVLSPIDGVIGQREQDLGSYVGGAAGQALLATVRKVDPLYVRFNVSESDLLRWQRLEVAGLVNTVSAADLSVQVVLADGRVFEQAGHIDYVDIQVEPATGTSIVRATIPNPNGNLLPGQYVKVRIGGVTRLGAFVVPKSAVLQSPAGANVYVVGEDGGAEMRTVELDEWTDEGWIVSAGLKAGDRVILDHLLQLRPGTPVHPLAD